MSVRDDAIIPHPTSPEVDQANRYRRFRVASQTLTRVSITDALHRPNVARYAGIAHDKDPDVRRHGHVVLEMRDGRTLRTIANMLNVPLDIVRPVIGQKGDPHSFTRAVRYLTHESPTEQAKGKYLYPDEEVFASVGYEWRREIDALRTNEGHLPPLLDRLKLQVLRGERSARSVLDEYPQIYIRHFPMLEKLEQHFLVDFASPAQLEAHKNELRRRMEARSQSKNE